MYQYKGDIIRTIDGDTVEALMDLGFKIYHKVSIRLAKLDAEAMNDQDPAKKELAVKAKEFVEQWVAADGKKAVINTYGRDQYGRWIGEILSPLSGKSLNSDLVASGLVLAHKP